MDNASQSFSLSEIAELTGSEFVGKADHQITYIENLEEAQSFHLSFLSNPLVSNPQYKTQLHITQAGAVIISYEDFKNAPKHLNYLLNKDPSGAFNKMLEIFLPSPESGFHNIHPTAIIHEKASVGKNVTIEPYVVIAQGAVIEDNTKIGAHCYIGANVKIGFSCVLYPNVTIRENCILGNAIVLQPGVVIGSCGFGYVTNEKGEHSLLSQLGNVILEDNVDVGANTTIDRARFKSTVIKQGTKIDNLVQIGHQVIVGNHSLIVAQVGISGSTKIGNYVVMGGKTGVAGHLSICDKAMFMACSAISKNITEPGIYGGAPAKPKKVLQEIYIATCKAPGIHKKVALLEKKLEMFLEQENKNNQSLV